MAVASEKSFPFDSDQVNGVYDREYFADDFARFFRAFISSGTFMNEASNLQVIANGDMSVTLKPGSMIIDGYRYDNVADIIINISPADGVLKRIDRVSATWSKEDRDIHYVVREGAYSYEPVAPECRRTAEYKDYVVADIIVEAGAISIKQSDIVDQRLNSEVCGLAMPFGEIDTSSLYDQIQAALEEFQNVNEKEFEEWFESIQGQLSEDAAGNLQNQIGILEDLTTQAKGSLVAAINEVNNKEVEVADPMEAKEEGKAADAKLTGDALKELNAKMECEAFDHEIALSNETDYICPSDGYFTVSCGWAAGSGVFGYINNQLMITISSTNSGSSIPISNPVSSIFVKKNMVIKYVNIANGSGRFIPFKTNDNKS